MYGDYIEEHIKMSSLFHVINHNLFFWYVGDKKSIYLVVFVLVNYNSHAQVSYYEHSGCFDYEHMLMLGAPMCSY